MSRPGSTLKFERAHKHLQEAKTDAAKFLARKPYEVVPDTDAYPGKLSYFLTLLESPPDSISLALGDAIHNCRTALDHAVYEASEKRETNPRDTAFPFCTKEEHWDSRDKWGELEVRSGKYKIRLLSSGAQTYVEGLQPYKGIDPTVFDSLLVPRRNLFDLHRLDVNDKHKKLNLAVLQLDITPLGVPEGMGAVPNFEYVFRGTLQPYARTEIVRLSFVPEMEMEPLPVLNIAFSESESLGEPAVAKVEHLINGAAWVLNTFFAKT